ncbi:MAG TPA: DUF2235 domain-containing protein [Lysobacter sp.]
MSPFKFGGIDTYPADAHDLDSYRTAEGAPIQLSLLVHADNPHERLYVATLDGTGNNKFKDSPENWSVVARTYEQITFSKPAHVAAGYVHGIGTQNHVLARIRDGLDGNTFDERVETAYFDFCNKAYSWLKEDPHAQVRVAGIGFSRGAEEVAALHRMIHERGIRNPESADFTRNKDGLITHIQYADRPLLREPGQTVQVALLYDPVSTGLKEHDRRLPPSVVAGVQITAEDERRDQFKSTTHIAQGCSDDGRFCNLTVGGSHSDIGNTYSKNGLGARSFNLGVDVLNALSDEPFLRKQAVPDDPNAIVVHRSEQHLMRLYTTRGFGDGERDRHTSLGGKSCPTRSVYACDVRQPVDAGLGDALEFRRMPVRPAPGETLSAPQPITFFPGNPSLEYLEAYGAAAQRGDFDACSTLTRNHAQLPHMQDMQQQGRDLYQADLQRQREEEMERIRQEQQRLAELQWQQEQAREHSRSRGRSM